MNSLKQIALILIYFSTPLVLIACGSSKSGSQYASAPTNPACLYGATTCDNSVYNNYTNYGFQPYPGQQTIVSNTSNANQYDIYNNSYYSSPGSTTFCSCPAGTRPVFNGSMGLGCVNVNVVSGISDQAYYWGSGVTTGNTIINWSQVSNIINGSNANGCYTTLMWSCSRDVQNSCFSGTVCQSVHNDSRLGICVRP